MTFDYVLLGKKLREARESLQFDIYEAAARLQISKRRLFEGGIWAKESNR